MKYKITDTEVFINNTIRIPKNNIQLLLNQDLLEISMTDLAELFTNLYGIPYNFLDYLKHKIKLYDKSLYVNSFIYNNNSYWFDKNTRLGLMNLLSCGGDSIQVNLGDEIVTFEASKFKKFLLDLEIYASKCYIATTLHLINAKGLKKLDEILNYDYTIGYPDKIILSNE